MKETYAIVTKHGEGWQYMGKAFVSDKTNAQRVMSDHAQCSQHKNKRRGPMPTIQLWRLVDQETVVKEDTQ